jgi:hypothetical protein
MNEELDELGVDMEGVEVQGVADGDTERVSIPPMSSSYCG